MTQFYVKCCIFRQNSAILPFFCVFLKDEEYSIDTDARYYSDEFFRTGDADR